MLAENEKASDRADKHQPKYIMQPLSTRHPYDRFDTSVYNVLLMLRPILEENELIGRTIKATELARICRKYHKRLPFRGYRGLELADQIDFIGRGSFVVGDLVVQAINEFDRETHRRSPSISFELAVYPEAEYLASLAQQKPGAEVKNET